MNSATRTPRNTKKRPEPSSRGAVQNHLSLGHRLKSWRQHHAISAISSLKRLFKTPVQTVMTCLVVAIAIALPTTLFIAIGNVQTVGESWDASPKVSVYLHLRANQVAIDRFQQTLQSRADVDNVVYISPNEALAQFREMSGFGNAVDLLETNPLPPTLVISPTKSASSPEALEKLSQDLKENTLVDAVDMDMDWVRRLREIMVLGEKIVTILASLLGIGVLLALGNSIRLAIENRREEIIIVKLVGGTNGFVRRPFLYTGAWYGFLGGLAALVLIGVGHSSLASSVTTLAAAYDSQFTLTGLSFGENAMLLTASVLLGLLSAWLAVGKHLNEIEPK